LVFQTPHPVLMRIGLFESHLLSAACGLCPE
jgi:predicted transcriptional regulator